MLGRYQNLDQPTGTRSNEKEWMSVRSRKGRKPPTPMDDAPKLKHNNRFTYLANINSNEIECSTPISNTHTKPNQKGYAQKRRVNQAVPKSKGDFSSGRVHIYADSHGKDLGNILPSLLPKSFETFVCASAGAKIDYVMNNSRNMTTAFTAEDTVIIIAGANDISDAIQNKSKPSNHILGHLQQFAVENSHTNIVYVTQIQRHDLAWNDIINQEIYTINYKLQEKKS